MFVFLHKYSHPNPLDIKRNSKKNSILAVIFFDYNFCDFFQKQSLSQKIYV